MERAELAVRGALLAVLRELAGRDDLLAVLRDPAFLVLARCCAGVLFVAIWLLALREARGQSPDFNRTCVCKPQV